MAFEVLDRAHWPRGLNFDLSLMDSSLSYSSAEKKYGFHFLKDRDDISSVELCLILSDSGVYYLVLGRQELPEQRLSIRTTPEDGNFEELVQRRIEDFVSATNVEVEDLEQIWDFVDVGRIGRRSAE